MQNERESPVLCVSKQEVARNALGKPVELIKTAV